jgi:hypothetical protein
MASIIRTDALQNLNTSNIISQTNATTITVGAAGQTVAMPGSVNLPTGSVGISQLSATGTPSSSNFLRGDNTWGAVSSDQLFKSIPLASGGSVTAGRAVFINSSGEVGVYPTLNTVGTEYSNSNATAYTVISNNGSRAIKISTSGTYNYTVTYTGVALTGSANATDGGTTVTSSATPPNNTTNYSLVIAYPISNDSFYICHAAGNGFINSPTNSGVNTKNFVITVDASGNCTKGTEVTINSANPSGGYGNSSYVYIGKITDDIFAFNAFAQIDYANINTYRTITISGTTITATADNEAASFITTATGFNNVYTTNNIIGCGTGTDWLTASYTAGNIGTVTTTTILTDSITYTPVWSRITNSRVMVYYYKTGLIWIIKTFNVNQTTGALTLVDEENVNSYTWGATMSNFRFKDQTTGIFQYSLNGFYYANSIEFDSSGNFVGFNLSSQIDIYSITPVYNTGNIFFLNYQGASTPKLRSYTVNAASTSSPNYLGVAKETDSTTPVNIVTNGVVGNFTGLTPGSLYYISTNYDGTVSTTSVSGILVGKAISTTEILMQRSNTQ